MELIDKIKDIAQHYLGSFVSRFKKPLHTRAQQEAKIDLKNMVEYGWSRHHASVSMSAVYVQDMPQT